MFKIWLKSVEGAGIKTLSRIDDIAGVVAGVEEDYGHSWLGFVSLVMVSIVKICSEDAVYKFWFKSVDVKGIKNSLKD